MEALQEVERTLKAQLKSHEKRDKHKEKKRKRKEAKDEEKKQKRVRVSVTSEDIVPATGQTRSWCAFGHGSRR